ncbi:MAG: exonuclease domain-containing protein [Alkalinema sp. CAN_BIN05]|nr:exonuclease domain-containing protein [Alkalinema sp. CAN_BIN05]
MPTFDAYLVVDLEATCGDTIAHHHREIIEIGAVMVNRQFQIESEFQTFVKPVANPQLTDFCTHLTSITQTTIDRSPDFNVAISQFSEWMTAYPNRVFCAWGDFDRRQIQRDCKRHHLKNPLNITCFNLKTMFARSQQLPGTYALKQAMDLAKLSFTGTQHRGIDDARNLAKLLPFALGLQRIDRNP